MRSKFLLLIFVLIIAGCTSTQVSTGYYDIKGKDARTLDREIKRKGPLKGHALASAAIQFEPVKMVEKEGPLGCYIHDAKIRVIAKITLPRWQNRSGADKDLKRAFNGLSRYAKLHEKIHVKIAEAAAKTMERELERIKPQKTCKRLERAAKKTIKSVLKRHDKAQKAFDAAEQKRLQKLFREAAKRA